ncbi:MAG: hypothetical protein WAO19_07790 [Candidatus Kryptoniota bacterium]
MNSETQAHNQRIEEFFAEGLSSFKLVANEPGKLVFKRGSIVRPQQLPIALIAVVALAVYLASSEGVAITAAILIAGFAYVSYYWSNKPVEIIAQSGFLTLVFKYAFVLRRELRLQSGSVESIKATSYRKNSGGASFSFAQVKAVLRSGKCYILYQGKRSVESIAQRDSERLADIIAAKVGIPHGTHSKVD